MAAILSRPQYVNLITEGDCFRHLVWNCSHVNTTEPYLSEVITGSGNGLVSSGNKP